MEELQLESGPAPEVFVEAQGSLRVRGWSREQVLAKAPAEGDLNMQQSGERVVVSARGGCELRVPRRASLRVQTAHGPVSVSGVEGALFVQRASTEVTLRNVGPARLEFVGTDLNAREVQGELTVGHVGRFASAHAVTGDFRAELVGAHLNLSAVEGDVSAVAHGNVNLYLVPAAGRTYTVQAGGVLTCHLPAEPDAQVNIQAQGPIAVRVGERHESSLGGSLQVTFGEGRASLNLSAQGPVTLLEGTPQEMDFDFEAQEFDEEPFADFAGDFAQWITQQVQAKMAILESQLEAHLGRIAEATAWGTVSAEKAERAARRAREKAERAREKMLRASQRAARRAAAAQRRAERRARRKARAGGHAFVWSAPAGRATSTQEEAVTDEERLMVLRMLAEEKITPEEAETLLAALEGRSE